MKKHTAVDLINTLVDAGIRVTRVVCAVREAKLYELNYELRQYGHPHFEPTISNAAAILHQYEEQTYYDSEFIHIIHENYHH